MRSGAKTWLFRLRDLVLLFAALSCGGLATLLLAAHAVRDRLIEPFHKSIVVLGPRNEMLREHGTELVELLERILGGLALYWGSVLGLVALVASALYVFLPPPCQGAPDRRIKDS